MWCDGGKNAMLYIMKLGLDLGSIYIEEMNVSNLRGWRLTFQSSRVTYNIHNSRHGLNNNTRL